MFITKVINGAEHQIELSREEMFQVAQELDIVSMAENVQAYLTDIDDECTEDWDENAKVNLQKYHSCTEQQKMNFCRYCAEGIINRAEEDNIALTDDLTDIFSDEIQSSILKIEEFI